MKPEYITSDLELRSRGDISDLVNELSRDLLVLFHGREGNKYLATFHVTMPDETPDKIANQYCKVIEGLPRKHRPAWKKCLSRNLDMGFDSGHGNRMATALVKSKTIKRLAKLEINIAVSVYPIMKRVARKRRR